MRTHVTQLAVGLCLTFVVDVGTRGLESPSCFCLGSSLGFVAVPVFLLFQILCLPALQLSLSSLALNFSILGLTTGYGERNILLPSGEVPFFMGQNLLAVAVARVSIPALSPTPLPLSLATGFPIPVHKALSCFPLLVTQEGLSEDEFPSPSSDEVSEWSSGGGAASCGAQASGEGLG